MASTEVVIATDVKNAIVAGTALIASVEQPPGGWGVSATAVRAYLAEYALSDMAFTRCTVIPATCEYSSASRAARQELHGVDVVLQSKPADLTAKDAVMELAETINKLFEHKVLTVSKAAWVGVERTPLFEREAFDEGQMFATSSRHTFLVIRAVS